MFKDIFKRIIKEEISNSNFNRENININNEIKENNAETNQNDVNINIPEQSINSNTNRSVYDNLVQEDKDFSEASFKAKVDNIFIQLYTAVMKQDLQRVKHFLADDVFEKYDRKVKQLQENNQLQIYDELNVSDTNIVNIEEDKDEFKIRVSLF